MRSAVFVATLAACLATASVQADVKDDELQALRAQIEILTKRLDELEMQNAKAAPAPQSTQATVARVEEMDKELEEVKQSVASLSWAEKLKWKGDLRYRYEYIDQDGKDSRNRNRIRARTSVVAAVSDELEVGVGLATGGDDPVSTNQTIGAGGSTKDIRLDLAYFKWKGLDNTSIIGGKFSNFIYQPAKKALRWDGDWRPEGLGATWSDGRYFASGLGTWIEGDSKKGTEFAWILQAGMNLDVGDGALTLGTGYSVFDVSGDTPFYGDPDDFFGNSYVVDPLTGDMVYAHDYTNWELFAEYKFKLGGRSLALFGNYTVNTDADDDDTGYLIGAKLGSVKDKGDWDFTYFYEKLEADATFGLLTDSDFGGGGTDAKGHVLSGTYAFHKAWTFKATYFINEIDLADGKDTDYDRLQVDLNFKF